MKKKQMVTLCIIAAVAVIIGFFGGMKYGENSAQAAAMAMRSQFGGAGGRSGGARTANGGFVTGQVLSKDAASITLKSKDGSTKIVLYSGTTQVMKSTSGSADDVAVGSQISVQGSSNSDGSVTAQSIQIRPAMPAPAAPAQ